MKKFEIYKINMGKGVGSEQGGQRYALIVQNNVGNTYSPTTIVAIISSVNKGRHIPTIISLSDCACLPKQSYVHCEQIFTYDKNRLGECVGSLKDSNICEKINKAISISFGLEG